MYQYIRHQQDPNSGNHIASAIEVFEIPKMKVLCIVDTPCANLLLQKLIDGIAKLVIDFRLPEDLWRLRSDGMTQVHFKKSLLETLEPHNPPLSFAFLIVFGNSDYLAISTGGCHIADVRDDELFPWSDEVICRRVPADQLRLRLGLRYQHDGIFLYTKELEPLVHSGRGRAAILSLDFQTFASLMPAEKASAFAAAYYPYDPDGAREPVSA